ncbi:sulfite reductase (NADPH) flavoprotein alpha-component [Natronospira proteinivora]|uniref:Sulfite reductase [NADPH] flavoprotein alpha-component n=1 Tax=Natronospira proteinivora TaxID=1807133 RepID=A0ABT1G916_9GAMM|nr:assimilatory sulfite reductase (NADPH) flavoprotein subunit [Natronospira proteinivora]MCP1727794.1 sulfite reductase (NADPH) flavoprotein alpha-component [Natronospira proteinivora]
MAAVPAQTLQLQQRIDALARELDEREKIWASGYLSGLAAAGGSAAPSDDALSQTGGAVAKTAASSSASRVLNIWYGSETGNARRVAEGLAEQARSQGLAVKLASLADVRPQQLRKQELLTLVVSTHGEGDPPEDAEALHDYLNSDKAPKLEQLSYAVFALGDSSYEHFCQTGKDFDQALERLGAKRALERVDADLDFEDVAAQWQQQTLETFQDKLDSGESEGSGPILQAVNTEATQWTRDHPFQAEVLASHPLTVAPSGKSVHHIELSLEDSGIQYQAGDSVGIWTDNAPELVEEVLELTGLDGEQSVTRKDQQRSLREWLGGYLELTRLSRPVIEKYAQLADAAELKTLLEDAKALRAWIEEHQVVDLLHRYPAELDADTLVQLLPGITPRMYSIASSPAKTPDEIHLTVKTLGGQAEQGLRAGAASWYLNERLETGDRVRLFVEPNPRFRLPEDGKAPVIMIGPGTGVAPFRAFVQERQALGHEGKNWLFFGEQHRRTDFLYQLEWQRHLKQGGLDRISLAFSRDQVERIYVQDRLRESGEAVFEWLEAGAHLYVCGDAKRMAADVDAALVDIVAQAGHRSTEAAQDYLKTLRRDGRYQKDVY